jgi:N-dimethylarginine dimethylaminohydrolase
MARQIGRAHLSDLARVLPVRPGVVDDEVVGRRVERRGADHDHQMVRLALTRLAEVEQVSRSRIATVAPFAVARTIYQDEARVAEIVFEGGDLAASKSFVFADANLVTHNLGHGDASRAHLQSALQRTFSQEIIWLGDEPGDVPEHHIMMYMVPLDDHRALVGDPRLGRELAPTVAADADVERHAARFDRVARELVDRGFTVTRVPVVVLPGAGSYVTYTNAVFDRDASGPVVYLPTYRVPVLDERATKTYESLGYRVVPIDVSTIYKLNGSLGCLVNVMARD